MKRFGRQRSAVQEELAGQFGGNMLGVGSTAAVATQQNLIALFISVDDVHANFLDCILELRTIQ